MLFFLVDHDRRRPDYPDPNLRCWTQEKVPPSSNQGCHSQNRLLPWFSLARPSLEVFLENVVKIMSFGNFDQKLRLIELSLQLIF